MSITLFEFKCAINDHSKRLRPMLPHLQINSSKNKLCYFNHAKAQALFQAMSHEGNGEVQVVEQSERLITLMSTKSC